MNLSKQLIEGQIYKYYILFASIEPVGTSYIILEKPKNWNINESVFTIRADFERVTSGFLNMFLSGDYINCIINFVELASSVHKLSQ